MGKNRGTKFLPLYIWPLRSYEPAAVDEWLGRSSHNRAAQVRDSLEAMDFFDLHAVVSFSSTTIFHKKKGHQRNGFIRNRRAKAPLI